MLTSIRIANLKRFEHVEIPLDGPVVLVGPNNAGKTTALQALSLWRAGVQAWWAQRGASSAASQRSGVVLNRTSVAALPVPHARQLWHDLRTHAGSDKVRIELEVRGVTDAVAWTCGMQFDYANSESFHCRPIVEGDAAPATGIPAPARDVGLAYLPPMSGLASTEPLYQRAFVDNLIWQGQTAGVLRNLCYLLQQQDAGAWNELAGIVRDQFHVEIDDPAYDAASGTLSLSYARAGKGAPTLDISSSGRGMLQVLLIGTYMLLNPGAIILLDEPDAHLEVLRQREVFDTLERISDRSGGQVVCVSHSEVMMEEAFGRGSLVALLGQAKLITDRHDRRRLEDALSKVAAVDYVHAEATGRVLYLEGSTDLKNLASLARRLGHPAADYLPHAFAKFVGNDLGYAKKHFSALSLQTPHLRGAAIFDHGVTTGRTDAPPGLDLFEWPRNELENYMFTRRSLIEFAAGAWDGTFEAELRRGWSATMEGLLDDFAAATRTRREPELFSEEWFRTVKASDDFLVPLLENFRDATQQPQPSAKRDLHQLVPALEPEEISADIVEQLDRVYDVLAAEDE